MSQICLSQFMRDQKLFANKISDLLFVSSVSSGLSMISATFCQIFIEIWKSALDFSTVMFLANIHH